MLYEQKTDRLYVGEACPFQYPSHVHEGVEIVYVHKGILRLTVNGQAYSLMPGDIIAIFPMSVHSYEGAEPQDSALCLGFSSSLISEYCTLLRTMMPVTPLVHLEKDDTELREVLDKLMAIPSGDYPPQTTAYIHLFLALLLQKMELRPVKDYTESTLIQETLVYITDHLTENLSLVRVAHAVGISQSHLSHIFSQRLHQNFRTIINGMRIERACSMLQDPNNSVKDVMFACGYENSRTFHRSFLSQVGMTPSEYRRQDRLRRQDAGGGE